MHKPLSKGHLFITDKAFGPNGVRFRGVPLYSIIGREYREDSKLLDGVRLQAVEMRSAPLLEKMSVAKTNEEIRTLRREISQLRYKICMCICTQCTCMSV